MELDVQPYTAAPRPKRSHTGTRAEPSKRWSRRSNGSEGRNCRSRKGTAALIAGMAKRAQHGSLCAFGSKLPLVGDNAHAPAACLQLRPKAKRHDRSLPELASAQIPVVSWGEDFHHQFRRFIWLFGYFQETKRKGSVADATDPWGRPQTRILFSTH